MSNDRVSASMQSYRYGNISRSTCRAGMHASSIGTGRMQGRATLKCFLEFAYTPPLARNSAWCSARVVKVRTSAVPVLSGVVS